MAALVFWSDFCSSQWLSRIGPMAKNNGADISPPMQCNFGTNQLGSFEVKRGHWIKKWEFEPDFFPELNQIKAFTSKINTTGAP